MAYDCFLTYASADRPAAGRIARRLAEAGIEVWFDKVQLKPGDNWHEKIEADCEASRIVLPVLTPRWRDSEWTKFETYGAEHVIPLLVEGAWEDVRTPPLDRSQAVDLPDGRGSESSWQDLLAKIAEHLTTPAPEKAPRLASLKHLAKSEHFVGRDRVLTDLHERFFRTPTTALTQGHPEVLAALGGVGKTTIARHYCEKFWRCYRQIFWVDCRQSIEQGFAQTHDALRGERVNAFRDLPVPEKAVWALAELSRRDNVATLLVLDNAEDEESAVKWVPKTGACHTLITSRYTAWSAVEKYEVWVLEPGPAVELLMLRSAQGHGARHGGSARAAGDLASKLGYLPLALEQAAAYVREQACGFGKYLELYAVNEKELLARKTSGLTDYPDSVYVTWRATVEKLSPGARAILRLHSFMAATAFPIEVYLKGAEIVAAEANAVVPGTVEGPVNEFRLRDFFGELAKYSMIRWEGDGEAFSVHALTQAVERHEIDARHRISVRHELGPGAVQVVGRSAELIANLAWPTWEANSRKLWGALVAHGEAAWRACRERGADQNPRMLEATAEAASLAGQYAKGIPLLRDALEAEERVLGPEHPDTLTSVNNLAALLERQGDYAAAEPLYRRALEARERALGPEHPDTLTSVGNLAGLLYTQGDYAAAEPLYLRALEAEERVLGPEHPDTLTTVNNLALLLQGQGDYTAAEPLYRRALEARERVLEPEHPDRLTTLNNLAVLLEIQGDYAAAEPLYRRALEARERVLGPEHPDTLTSLESLADVLEKTGALAEARSFRQIHLDRMLAKRANLSVSELRPLALELYLAGRYEDSAELYRTLIAQRFELPGTYLHLARALLMTDRDEDSTQLIKLAAGFTGTAPPYMFQRVAYFQILLGALKGQVPEEPVARVRGELARTDAFVEFDLTALLEHLEPRVAPGDFEFLTALAEAINDRGKLPALQAFPQWAVG